MVFCSLLILSTSNFHIVMGLLFILLGCLGFFGFLFNIKGINNLYFNGWIKNVTRKKQLSFYSITSFVLIVIGFLIIKYKIFFTTPFSS